jgi:hypothetical protein
MQGGGRKKYGCDKTAYKVRGKKLAYKRRRKKEGWMTLAIKKRGKKLKL